MEKKRLIIGDIHGNGDVFKDIYEKESPDEVILMGDYFDSFTRVPVDQRLSMEEILRIRDKHDKGQFIILLGNHDFHYLTNVPEKYSGYNNETATFACHILEEEIKKENIQYIYIDEPNKTIYSHAGITNLWLDYWADGKLENVNTLRRNAFLFAGFNIYGEDPRNGPLWVRPNSMISNAYKDKDGVVWNQIVGHTNVKKVTEIHEYGANFIITDAFPKQYCVMTLDDNNKMSNFEIKDVE